MESELRVMFSREQVQAIIEKAALNYLDPVNEMKNKGTRTKVKEFEVSREGAIMILLDYSSEKGK